VTLGTQADAVVIPAVALQTGQNGPFVFVVRDGKAAVSNVTVSRTIGDIAVIEKGLTGGEDVITSGQLRLVAGSSVVARPPATTTAPSQRAPQG
jgi:multidrug efflux system membrane fusion protein